MKKNNYLNCDFEIVFAKISIRFSNFRNLSSKSLMESWKTTHELVELLINESPEVGCTKFFPPSTRSSSSNIVHRYREIFCSARPFLSEQTRLNERITVTRHPSWFRALIFCDSNTHTVHFASTVSIAEERYLIAFVWRWLAYWWSSLPLPRRILRSLDCLSIFRWKPKLSILFCPLQWRYSDRPYTYIMRRISAKATV